MALIILINTLFGIGYLPVAPAFAITLGAVWGYHLMKNYKHWKRLAWAQVILAIVTTSLAINSSHEDPSIFVIDEFVAASTLPLFFDKLPFVIAGAFLFGVLDYVKPIARLVEDLPGGFGVVGDDLTSVFTAVTILFTAKYSYKKIQSLLADR